MTSGSAVVTSATAAFTPADVGKLVSVQGALTGPAVLTGTVVSVQDSQNATLSVTATRTVTAQTIRLASDDTTGLENALAALGQSAAFGLVGYLPAGIYGTIRTLTIQSPCWIMGDGYEYSGTPPTTTTGIARGTVITCFAAGQGAGLVLGAGDGTPFTTGTTGAKVQDLAVDAANLAANGIKTQGRRSRVWRCQAYYATTNAFWLNGQNSHAVECIGGNAGVGVVFLSSNNDVKILNCEGRGGGTAQVQITAPGCNMVGGHYYNGSSTTNVPDVIVSSGDDTLISGVTFDGTGGHHILVQPGANGTVDALTITGCLAYQVATAFTDNNGAFVRLDATASGSSIQAVTITGNSGKGGPSKRLSSIVSASGTVKGVTATGNAFRYCLKVFSGTTTLVDGARRGNAVSQDGTTWLYSARDWSTSQTGDGSKVAFTTPHGLADAPQVVTATPASQAAAAPYWVTSDATNVTITFSTAPANGATITFNLSAII